MRSYPSLRFSLRLTAGAVLCATLSTAQAQTQPPAINSSQDDQHALAITIYNENLALVKDQRQIHLPSGTSTLALGDVSARIRPETALLRHLQQADALRVLEQNFDFDLLTPQKLLDKSMGRSVRVLRTNPATGADTTETATVLSTQDGLVLQYADQRIENSLPANARVVFADVPSTLRSRPTLSMLVNMQANNRATNQAYTPHTPQDVELSYLTSGLGWKADYVVELSPDTHASGPQLNLSGWVTLTNTSGTSYRNARLQLVAGDVNQVAPPERQLRTLAMAATTAKVADGVREESLFEYHLYSLQRPTTLENNQTKQVALLSASGVPARKVLLLQGQDYYYLDGVVGNAGASNTNLGERFKVSAWLEFDNTERAQLGLPLPKGVVRVYQRDAAGSAQFLGEDRIDHTPAQQTVRLRLGNAFDVTADKKQTDFKKLPANAAGSKYRYSYESAYELVLKNAKKEAVTVTVQEPVPGDWQIIHSNLPSTKGNAHTATWSVTVPAQGQATLSYRVVVRM
ncbi:DUF4139 domain-containing protein [Curvibacter sp. CHRR-16]|uniref:DUF4139 domain-containing protein n=1 Tax=Curvibacter sp. CHRR-16 TaxID=2835872 RepID=UPI001BDB4C94|nr:DUF4139 domain-containing protein [Curvibacter sp. CHRR-16]MBT0571655.1 DUF4139 domain-containing protein [Curvibacter sp. CHRR-16]